MDVASLCAHWASNPLPLIFFWGHTPKHPDHPGVACFSQWYPAPFMVNGDHYPTAEHWMMAEKARIFGDTTTRAQILATPGAPQAKALGRKVRGFDEATWIGERFAIVETGSRAKFSQNPALAAILQRTGQAVLVEAAPNDRIWGIGLAATDPAAQDPLTWKGLNLLGFALMNVRDAP